MTDGIIICHGQLAFELINTLNKLFGDVKGLHPLSSDFLAPETLYDLVVELVKKNGIKNFIIMVDLRGGNCWKVGKMLGREFSAMKILSGVNIPMLISFLNKRDKLPLIELASILEKDANRGIVLE